MTYVGNKDISGSDNICNGTPCDTDAAQVGTLPMPINYAFDDAPCTYTDVTDMTSNPAYWQDPVEQTTLNPGVYCNETGKIVLAKSDVEGTVTLVGHEVNLAGGVFNLTPYWNDILIFATSDGPSAIDASGSGGSWTGIMYAPNGEAKIAGSGGLSIVSSIIADTVILSGSDFSLQAIIGVAASSAQIALIE